MKKEKKLNSLVRLLKLCYIRIVRINDTPQKKALGFGLGVFLGILPGSGPIAALIMASFLRLNRASALLGSLLTNTWLSIVTFILALKTGAYLMRIDWHKSFYDWNLFLRDFHFVNLFKLSLLKMILPVLLGYFVVSLFAGLTGYSLALAVIKFSRRKIKNLPI